MSAMLTGEIDALLIEFAKWNREGANPGTGYPSQSTFRRLLGSTVRGASIDDDLAGLIDQELRVLDDAHPDWHELASKYYGFDPKHGRGKSIQWLSDRGYGDYRTVSKKLETARAFIERGLILELVKAATK